jgi:hypothetical protein
MFNGQVERELLEGEYFLFGQLPQLQPHLQFFIDEQQEKRDTWELPKENSPKWGLTKRYINNSQSF